MKVIKTGTLLKDLEPLLFDVEVVTGGYVTEVNVIKSSRLERFATSSGMDKIVFYINEKEQIFSLHFAHRLDLQESVCAIDYFTAYTREEVSKISDLLLNAIKNHRIAKISV